MVMIFFQGKVVVVIGGFFGIGLVIVEFLLEVGVVVVFCGCDGECLQYVEVVLCEWYFVVWLYSVFCDVLVQE